MINKNYMMYTKYSLDCSYFVNEFKSINELVDYVVDNGMDPNYEITANGNPTGVEQNTAPNLFRLVGVCF